MAIFTNQATLSYNNTVTNSNIATGEILEVLSASKTAVSESYSAGGDVTYVISILNSGPTPLSAIQVEDNLGAYTVENETFVPLSYLDGSARLFINGVLQGAPNVTQGESLIVSGINIPAGGNAILLYEASINSFAPLSEGSVITNTAEISGNGITTPIRASFSLPVSAGATLSITKSISPAVVTENSRVTYTFVIQNTGNTPADASENAFITDTFNPILSDLVVTFNGQIWTEGTNYNYNDATGLFTTVPGQITVPAATFQQNPATGVWETTPGTATLVVVGTI